MESLLLFFLVGLFIFVIKNLTKNQSRTNRFLAFSGGGFLSGAVIGLAIGSPLDPLIDIPWWQVAVIGSMAGMILFRAEMINLFTYGAIRHFSTILLGLVLSILSYGLFLLHATIAQSTSLLYARKTVVILVFILIGFITMFGYTFPERWFKQRNSQNN
ncbi:hypothetical protein JW824_02435 [bacterium]|nr:hypothetical protein [bacterium]RQV93264.1 MAG: hypothetical protein EH221_09830 [bacterium]